MQAGPICACRRVGIRRKTSGSATTQLIPRGPTSVGACARRSRRLIGPSPFGVGIQRTCGAGLVNQGSRLERALTRADDHHAPILEGRGRTDVHRVDDEWLVQVAKGRRPTGEPRDAGGHDDTRDVHRIAVQVQAETAGSTLEP